MIILTFSMICTTLLYLADVLILKSSRKSYVYMIFFISTSCLQYLFPTHHCKANYDCEPFIFDIRREDQIDKKSNEQSKKLDHHEKIKKSTKEFLKKCKEKIHYHREEGEICFKKAENACILFPERTDQEKARFCFHTIVSTLYPGTPAHRIIAAIITSISQHALDMILEWQYGNTMLYQAKYHFEMEEHYIFLYNNEVRQYKLLKNNEVQ